LRLGAPAEAQAAPATGAAPRAAPPGQDEAGRSTDQTTPMIRNGPNGI
jgi:hypothetical protein